MSTHKQINIRPALCPPELWPALAILCFHFVSCKFGGQHRKVRPSLLLFAFLNFEILFHFIFLFYFIHFAFPFSSFQKCPQGIAPPFYFIYIFFLFYPQPRGPKMQEGSLSASFFSLCSCLYSEWVCVCPSKQRLCIFFLFQP